MEFYNKHYITVDERSRIVDGFSDAFRQPSDTDICINEQGGYQFRFSYKIGELYGEKILFRSEENPCLFTYDLIPLYKWEDEVIRRTEEEIEADRAEIVVPNPEPTADELMDILLGVSE